MLHKEVFVKLTLPSKSANAGISPSDNDSAILFPTPYPFILGPFNTWRGDASDVSYEDCAQVTMCDRPYMK